MRATVMFGAGGVGDYNKLFMRTTTMSRAFSAACVWDVRGHRPSLR